jgi:hypothetical protein
VDDFSVTVVLLVVCDPATRRQPHHLRERDHGGRGPRGGVTSRRALTRTGGFSLLTTGRTASWQGPAINAAGWLCTGR